MVALRRSGRRRPSAGHRPEEPPWVAYHNQWAANAFWTHPYHRLSRCAQSRRWPSTQPCHA